MTTEQCIEVAEKVWGWKKSSYGGDRNWIEPGDAVPVGSYFDINRLKDEVNSWTGFGRTVEAMRERKAEWPWFLALMQGGMNFDNCIERCHLAALEARNTE